jgi:acyl-CoA synthetase (AMP-forming)/AMP-acid ligase II
MACGVFPAWLAGAGSVILPYFDPALVIEAIEKWRCTFTTGVPAMYKMILNERQLLSEHDVSSMSFLSCGSAPMPASLLAELQEVFGGVDLMEGYGLTEGGPLISILPRFGKRRIGSIGLVLPETEIRLCDPFGEEVPAGEAGELWVRGPGVAKGYHNRPEATAARFVGDGWLRSGDLIRQDEDGFLYFVGRVDDRINVAGEHAYPSEIESILIDHPAVQDVCVVGRRHDVKGEVPIAFVVPDGEPPSFEELREWFFERGPKFAHPREVIFLDALPLAATGKVDRRCLAQQAADARMRPAS